MANELLINYDKFQTSKLTFTKLEENSRSKGQSIAYPRYDSNGSGGDGPLYIQTPWIKLNFYGVPQQGEYYPSDLERSHIRLPLDMSNLPVKEFADKIIEIDNKLSTPEMMETLFGKKAKKYKYQPIYREGQDPNTNNSDDEEEVNTKKKSNEPRPPYMKIKLDLSWPDNMIKTKVFESVLDPVTKKRTRTLMENIQSVDDFAKHVRYLSSIRLVIRAVKLWAHPTTKKDPQYGIVFKVTKVEVEPSPRTANSISKEIYESDKFIDSDNEDEVLPKIEKLSQQLNEVTIQNAKVEDSSESESDDVIVEKVKQAIVQVESDSSDDSEEEEPVVSKSKSQAKKPVQAQTKQKKK